MHNIPISSSNCLLQSLIIYNPQLFYIQCIYAAKFSQTIVFSLVPDSAQISINSVSPTIFFICILIHYNTSVCSAQFYIGSTFISYIIYLYHHRLVCFNHRSFTITTSLIFNAFMSEISLRCLYLSILNHLWLEKRPDRN